MTHVRFTEPAAQDIEEIYDYIALDNIEAARHFEDTDRHHEVMPDA